jgi:DNA mismatch repair protein MutL
VPRIVQLTPLIVARIAAGEVIERPASVLKEMLENSIDAGGTRIDVEISQGGLDGIRVVDDGCGIDADDLPLAFAAHATSKLRSADDLATIGTLGFRGEGLASIGAVAQVCLQSRPAGADRGGEVRCDGGDLSEVRPWNGSPGTRVEVRHLFYNTPARRKFLRGPSTEMGHISEVFTRIALSNLGLHLTLNHNGRRLHDIPASAGLLDRVAAFYGDDLGKQLRAVEGEHEGMTLGGYAADPICERGGAQMQYVYVNGRWVRDRFISQALQEAYRGLLLAGKHPVAFLFLDMPPDAVDVNVHPAKSKVRFRQPDKVQHLVQTAVRAALRGEDLTAPLRVPPARKPAAPGVNAPTQSSLAFGASPKAVPAARRGMASAASPVPAPRDERRVLAPTPVPPDRQRVVAPTPDPTDGLRGVEPAPAPIVAEPPAKAVQMHDTYLWVEVPEGVLVIDQHALHERILFERLKARFASGRLEVQKLLVPETVQLPPAQAALLLEHRADLLGLGLEIDDFGGGTVLMGGYPHLLAKKPPGEILRAVAEELAAKGRVPTREALLNDLMALLACHSAVRAGDRLSAEQVRQLAAERHLVQDSHHCPHGRPSSLLFTRAELDKQFRRSG